MKQTLEKEAQAECMSAGAYARGVLAERLIPTV